MSSKKKVKFIPTRNKVVLPLKVKIDILDRLRVGESFASISRSFNVNESTVRYIKKCESKIRNSIASNSLSAKIVRDPAIEKMEVALSLWIEDRNPKEPLSGPLIREKARSLYAHFKEPGDERPGGGFQASEGWFNKFKVRQSLHCIKFAEESASAEAAAKSVTEDFANIIADGGYKPEQVFNADETVLYWKRMPSKTLISKCENSAPGFKPAKDRVTLLLCSNASGDCVMKPVMVYKSLNPHALKNQSKDNLPVLWRANKNLWVTSAIFCDWFRNCFIPELETYLKKKSLDFKALLVLDDAPSHPHELQSMHPNIKVIFLPSKTTAFLQPMDQGIIQIFKLYYIKQTFQMILDSIECDPEIDIMQCWKNFDIAKAIVTVVESLEELKPHTLKSCWKNLWPVLMVENEEECMEIQILSVDIVQTANKIGKDGFEEIEISDIQELFEYQEDFMESDMEEMSDSHCNEEQTSINIEKVSFNLKNLTKGLQMANKLCDFFVKIDPSLERSLLFKRQIVNATAKYQSELKNLLKVTKQGKFI